MLTDFSVTYGGAHTNKIECIYKDLNLFVYIVFEKKQKTNCKIEFLIYVKIQNQGKMKAKKLKKTKRKGFKLRVKQVL